MLNDDGTTAHSTEADVLASSVAMALRAAQATISELSLEEQEALMDAAECVRNERAPAACSFWERLR